MNTRPPFSFLQDLADRLPRPPRAPDWLVHGVQHRLVLWLNHVLMQEPLAMQRLQRHSGRVALVRWRGFSVALQVTPAGLLDLAPEDGATDLRVELMQGSALGLARDVLAGERPAVHIEGDVQLAADIHWLAENLRWDAAEDLSRVVGDGPAPALVSAAGRIQTALRGFVARRRPAATGHTPS